LLLLLQPAGDVAAGASPAMLPLSVSFVCDFRAALGHFRTQYLGDTHAGTTSHAHETLLANKFASLPLFFVC